MVEHSFGGAWTEEKLERLRKYLPAYLKIMHGNPRARHYFQTMYVDAFAGTGYRQPKKLGDMVKAPAFDELNMIDEALSASETQSFLEGSAKIALDLEPAFDHYLFIDTKISHVRDLEQLRLQYRNAPFQIDIRRGDANIELQRMCRDTDWRQQRAVVFLDSYGMAVDWATIEALGTYAKVDLWLLFPLAQAVNRVLTRRESPPAKWSEKLDRFFGTHDWQDAFYATPQEIAANKGQGNLFVEETTPIKSANFDSIGDFFVQRLKAVFPQVATPKPLLNSQGVPLYLLCFASHNETALKIAGHLLKN